MSKTNDNQKDLLGKRIVVIHYDPDGIKETATVLGKVKDIDEFTVTVIDDYGNVQIVGKRAIIKIKIKSEGGQNE